MSDTKIDRLVHRFSYRYDGNVFSGKILSDGAAEENFRVRGPLTYRLIEGCA